MLSIKCKVLFNFYSIFAEYTKGIVIKKRKGQSDLANGGLVGNATVNHN